MIAAVQPIDGLGKKKLALSRAIDTDFSVPTPGGRALFPFQRVGVEYASLCDNVLNADPPGVGKTIQEIGFMNVMGMERALILCPASLLYNWKREIETWHLGFPDVQFFNPKTFDPKRPPDILLVSYYWAANAEAVKLIMRGGKYPLMTLDECQNLKTPESKRTKYVLAKNGLKSIAERVHCLSGTPLVNRPMDLWPLLGGLFPEVVGGMSKFQYGIEFCAGFKSPWGWDFDGASKLPILGTLLRGNCMVRRAKADVLKSLPERYPPNLVYLDQSPAAKRACKRMELYDSDAIKRTTVSYEFTDMSEARKELGLAKVPAAVSYITEVLRGGHEKILIFAHHREVIEKIHDALNEEFGAIAYLGGLSAKEKDERVRRFQDGDDARIMILSLSAGGVGLTLTRASYVIFVEFSWVPGENEQAIDRTHRIGQTKGVVTDYLVFEDSLDERQLKYCFNKQGVFNKVFE